jgi:putative Mg2+ transporter-C (MgtC) family protein
MQARPTLPEEEMILRLLLSLVLGGIIGLEREWRDRTAGLRTHMLVCIGSAAFTMISAYGFGDFYGAVDPTARVLADPARIAAQVVSGIGFLGAGAIFQSRGSVRGLTTAASLWVMAAIGMAVGAGEYVMAVIATIAIVLVLALLRRTSRRIKKRRHRVKARFEIQIGRIEGYRDLFDALEEHKIVVTRLESEPSSDVEWESRLVLDVDVPPQKVITEVAVELLSARGIESVSVEERH